MSRIAGRNGILYANIASGGTAEPIAFLTKFSMSFASDKIDQTAFGDTNKVYTAGLPDASGDYTGWYDTATAQLLTAAQDGVARKFYFYPSTSSAGQYWYGTGLFDFGIDADYSGGVAISGSWAANSTITKVG